MGAFAEIALGIGVLAALLASYSRETRHGPERMAPRPCTKSTCPSSVLLVVKPGKSARCLTHQATS